MWTYLLLVATIFVLLVLSIIYIVRFTHRIIKKYINSKLVSWILSFIPILLLAVGLFIDTINAVVVDIHFIVIYALIKLLFLIIKKISA